MESFLGHLLAGGVFCLLGGQPLTVLGCTGPVTPCSFYIFPGSHLREDSGRVLRNIQGVLPHHAALDRPLGLTILLHHSGGGRICHC